MVVLFKDLDKTASDILTDNGLKSSSFSQNEVTFEKKLNNGPNLKLATTLKDDTIGAKVTAKHSIKDINVEVNVTEAVAVDAKIKLSPVNNLNVEIKGDSSNIFKSAKFDYSHEKFTSTTQVNGKDSVDLSAVFGAGDIQVGASAKVNTKPALKSLSFGALYSGGKFSGYLGSNMKFDDIKGSLVTDIDSSTKFATQFGLKGGDFSGTAGVEKGCEGGATAKLAVTSSLNVMASYKQQIRSNTGLTLSAMSQDIMNPGKGFKLGVAASFK